MKLKTALCQVDMEWERTAGNLARLEAIVAAPDADVVVLPEMFATGFKLRPSVVAEPTDGLVATTMRRWAERYDRAVAGSVVIAEGGEYRNRMFFVEPSGTTRWYDKRHLFRPGGEGARLHPGRPPRGGRVQGLAPAAARLLRPALPGVEPQPGRLRRHSVLRLVGR